MFVRERVFARRIEDDERTIRHDRAELFVVDRVNLVAAATDADRPEVARRLGFDDAVDVLSLLSLRLNCLRLLFHSVVL